MAAYYNVSPTKILSTDASALINVNALPTYTMIRTGVQGLGSCYLHALFTDINGKEFRSLSIPQRDALIHECRRKFAVGLTLQDYTKLLDGELAKLEVFKMLQKNWLRLYTEVYSDEVKKKYGHNIFNLLSEIHTKIKNLVNIDMEIEKLDPILRKDTKNILEVILKKTHSKFQMRLAEPSEYIDQYFTKYIDDKLGVNVIFLKPNGDLWISSRQDCDEMKSNNRPFILVYYLDSKHFEAIGRINANGQLESYFPTNDPMIAQLLSTC
uniref:Uncharacterized protein n=1 Tax=viral metagenome TaxID=1070528 RepID=A0A6C0KQA6_9ZZZZ